MTFLKNFVVVLLAVVSLAACADDKPQPGDTTGGSDTATFGSDGVASTDTSNLTPGSKEEFIAAVGDRVFFDFNSATLTQEGQDTLKKQADWLKQYSDKRVTVEGHCDERGTREYNLALGERRAAAVKSYLASLGVDASRVNSISYGKEHPEYLGSNEAAWSKNRRGVTVIN